MVERSSEGNHEDVKIEKERAEKDDGRYIILYSFGGSAEEGRSP